MTEFISSPLYYYGSQREHAALFGQKFEFDNKYPGLLGPNKFVFWREGMAGGGTVVFEVTYKEQRTSVSVGASDLPDIIAKLQKLADVFAKEGTPESRKSTALASKLSRIEAILKE